MAALPYMPLYVADYMSDAAHLTCLEHGAYLQLLMTYWQRGEALPDDDKKLARICGLDARNWAKVKPQIREFFTTGDNKLVHSRVERELAKVRDKSLKNRKGGLARAQQMQSERAANAEKTLSHTDTDTYTPLSKDNGADAHFWANSKAFLEPFVGKSKAGSLIGKWSRDFGKPETAQAITAAQLERPAEPVAYIERVLRNGRGSFDFVGGPC